MRTPLCGWPLRVLASRDKANSIKGLNAFARSRRVIIHPDNHAKEKALHTGIERVHIIASPKKILEHRIMHAVLRKLERSSDPPHGRKLRNETRHTMDL